MISKKLRKMLVVTLSITTVLSSSSFITASSVSQTETSNEPVQILSEEDEVLNQEEIEDLIQENEDFSRIYEQQMSQGATLEEVTVTAVEVQDKSRAKKNGKIYDSSFRQPVKRKTVYYRSWLNTASQLNDPVQFAVSFIKYSWIPVNLLGLRTDMLDFLKDNGRDDLVQDETYHNRLVTYIDSSTGKEWSGYAAGYSHIALSIIHVHEDKNQNKFNRTVDRTFNFYSKNYKNKNELLRLAKTVSMYREEYVNYPDKVVIN